MHDTAMAFGKLFFDSYHPAGDSFTIVDLGAQDVNGSLRQVAPAHATYIGVDYVAGKGVDIVLTEPYHLPFADASVDMVVSSSCFEHAEFFWLTFLEMLRILRPDGLLYLNAPSNGPFHRFPVDCWRFYPDSGVALQKWGNRNHVPVALLESFVGKRQRDVWNDFVAVFVKDKAQAIHHNRRMIQATEAYYNGISYTDGQLIGFQHPQHHSEDALIMSNLI